MKKILLLFFILTFVFSLSGCDVFKDSVDSFKSDKNSSEHSHNKDDDTEDTSVNLNYKVADTTKKTTTDKDSAQKTTTPKSEKTTEHDDDPEYPYINVNDGDTTVYEWPKEGPAVEFPELKSGTMKKPFISKKTFSVYYANVDPVEFDKYLKNLEKLGFEIDDSVDKYLYIARKDGIKIEFFYDTSKLGNNTLSLMAIYVD